MRMRVSVDPALKVWDQKAGIAFRVTGTPSQVCTSRFCPTGKISGGVGWVEPCAKPITVVQNMMGIASLHPSYALRADAHSSLREAKRRSNPAFYLRRQIRIASLLAMTVSRRAPHSRSSSPGLTGRPGTPEMAAMESRSRSVLDTALEPVIGLAEGETRWRGMTAVGARNDATKASISSIAAQYFDISRNRVDSLADF